MIYLDHAATTPVHPEVIEAMMEELKFYGNPSSKYYPEAVSAQQRLKKYRETVAHLFGVDASNIIFNSGATEGNNAVIMGCFYANPEKRHFITSNAEHKSVLETMKFIESLGAEVTYLPVTDQCRINPEDLSNAIKEDTNLVSIFFANNEVGTLNDINALAHICNQKNVLFHTDATQAVGKIDINLSTMHHDGTKVNIDFLTFSGHKIYGPKGVGAMYVGNNEYGFRHMITPFIHGGDQEYKLRAGTQAMHNIAALAKACELAQQHIELYATVVLEEENTLIESLKQEFGDKLLLFGDFENKVPGIISFALEGLNNEMFLKNYCNEVSLSTGSACAINEPSHVLKAMGYGKYIKNVLRMSCSFSKEIQNLLPNYLIDYLEKYQL